MIDLEKLLVVTGSLHVEGGEKTSTTSEPGQRRGRMTITQEKSISAARRLANSIVAQHGRRLRRLRLLISPYGTLVAPSQQRALRQLMLDGTRRAAEFNRETSDTRLWNCYVVEPLAGPRLQGLRGWIERRIREGDVEIRAALDS